MFTWDFGFNPAASRTSHNCGQGTEGSRRSGDFRTTTSPSRSKCNQDAMAPGLDPPAETGEIQLWRRDLNPGLAPSPQVETILGQLLS